MDHFFVCFSFSFWDFIPVSSFVIVVGCWLLGVGNEQLQFWQRGLLFGESFKLGFHFGNGICGILTLLIPLQAVVFLVLLGW